MTVSDSTKRYLLTYILMEIQDYNLWYHRFLSAISNEEWIVTVVWRLTLFEYDRSYKPNTTLLIISLMSKFMSNED